MKLPDPLHRVLSDESWRYPVAAGLFALLVTLWEAWPSVYEFDPPVFLAAAVAAYLYYGRGDVDSEQIGRRAAMVASLPMLAEIGDLVVYEAIHDPSPLWFRVGVGGFIVVLFVALWWAIAVVLVGTLGAKAGAWLAENTDLPRPRVGRPTILTR